MSIVGALIISEEYENYKETQSRQIPGTILNSTYVFSFNLE